MTYLRWLFLTLLDWLLLLTVPFVAPIVAAFYREQPYGRRPYTWGWLYGTWDNPPQGDQGFVRQRALFLGVTTGFKGYLNRVMWMLRNPLYGFAKLSSTPYDPEHKLTYVGNPDVSDKYKNAGFYFAKLHDNKKLIAFEFYCVYPWAFGRCLRVRIGWKLMTDKFQRYGFAQLVNTCNPFSSFGDN